MKCFNAISDSMYVSFSKLQELVIAMEAWHPAVLGVTHKESDMTDWAELYILQRRTLGKYSGELNNSLPPLFILYYYYFAFSVSYGLWEISSPNRIWTWALGSEIY